MTSSMAALFKRLTQGVYVVGVAHGEARNAFTAAWVMQVSFDPLLLALSINPNHSSYRLLKEGRAFSVNVLNKGQLGLAEHYGRPARADKLAGTEGTTDRLGLPLLPEALAWFECQVLSEYPAGDHGFQRRNAIVVHPAGARGRRDNQYGAGESAHLDQIGECRLRLLLGARKAIPSRQNL